MDGKFFVHPNSALSHVMEGHSPSLYKWWCWLQGSDFSVATEYEHNIRRGQRGFRYTALLEVSDISYHISLTKHKKISVFCLHAGKHVALSAGGGLTLEGK